MEIRIGAAVTFRDAYGEIREGYVADIMDDIICIETEEDERHEVSRDNIVSVKNGRY